MEKVKETGDVKRRRERLESESHQVPDPVLVRVLRDVASEGTSLQSVLYALTLEWEEKKTCWITYNKKNA